MACAHSGTPLPLRVTPIWPHCAKETLANNHSQPRTTMINSKHAKEITVWSMCEGKTRLAQFAFSFFSPLQACLSGERERCA